MFVVPILLPVIGWRGMFFVGAFPAIVAYFIRQRLHEPALFVAKVQNASQTKNPLWLLVKDAETLKRSLGMVILCSIANFGYYGVMIWLPELSVQRGSGSGSRNRRFGRASRSPAWRSGYSPSDISPTG